MATGDILNCDGTDPFYQPDWSKVVGEKTLEDGGRIGDLLTIVGLQLDEAKANGYLREMDVGVAYASAIEEAMKNSIAFELGYPKAQLELCFLQAQIDKLKCDCENETALRESQIKVDTAKIANDTDRTESTISLNAAQENKLACDCCNTSAITAADIEYRYQQIEKSICDCTNSTLVSAKQAELYRRQAEGFDDNANQKLYDTQMQAWSMVFADSEIDTVTSSIATPHISDTYNRLAERLGSTFDAPPQDYT